MIPHSTIRAIADEVIALHAHGCKALAEGDVLTAQLRFSIANVKLHRLRQLLDADAATQKPLRKLALVSAVRESTGDELEVWMERTHGEPGDGAA